MAAEVIEGEREEYLDVLTKTGEHTGISKPRGAIHRDGDYHRAVHVWIYAESTQELLLQQRADCGLWDISSAGHISAGESSLMSARRELEEELGIKLPENAFELIFVSLQESFRNDGKYINNEYDDVYLVTTLAPIPLEAFSLQESEVLAVKYISVEDYRSLLAKEDPDYFPKALNGQYGQLFEILAQRKGQTLQFNYLFEKGAFRLHPDQTFPVDFNKVEDAVKSLSTEILTVQARGDKDAAGALLQKYGVVTQPLRSALEKLEAVQVLNPRPSTGQDGRPTT